MSNIIKKALVSEKSFQNATASKFTFLVGPEATKEQIAEACKDLFNITVISCNSMNYKGKVKMTKRVKGKRNNFKKVVVTAKKGDKIDLFEIESTEEPKGKNKKQKIKNAPMPQSQIEDTESRPKGIGKNKDVEVTIKKK